MSVDLLEAVYDCTAAVQKLLGLLEEDREDISGCIDGEVLQEYLRGTDRAQEILVSLMDNLRAILSDI